MASTVSLYSSSPPSALFTTTFNGNSSSSVLNGDIEGIGIVSINPNSSHKARGGLSVLLNNSSKSSQFHQSSENLETSFCSSSSIDTLTSQFKDSDFMACASIPASPFRPKDRSPVSTLAMFGSSPSWNSSPSIQPSNWDASNSLTSFMDPHFYNGLRRTHSTETRNSFSHSIGYTYSQKDSNQNNTSRSVGFQLNHSDNPSLMGSSKIHQSPRGPSGNSDIELSDESAKFNPLTKNRLPRKAYGSLPSSESIEMLRNREKALRMAEAANGLLTDSSIVSSHQLTKLILNDEGLLFKAQSQHPMFYDKLVRKAFAVACNAHRRQIRKNGQPTITHCIETAMILAQTGAENLVVAAGLLHDTLDDSALQESQLNEIFGTKLTRLITGVSKLSGHSQLVRNTNVTLTPDEYDRLRTMFLAMTDVRVVLIKLADRIHNLRTLDALPFDKQQRIASESLKLFAPLANRLGIWKWKAEIEDICFKYLYPDQYQKLDETLAKESGSDVIMSAMRRLNDALSSKGINVKDLSGRPKNIYSIYQKMINKGKKLDEIHDIRALRVIVPDEESCYAALDVVHSLWDNSDLDHFKDYIRKPKSNGYKSLHTVVRGENGKSIEVQIRTEEMHHHAEFGVAAHWRYKEGSSNHSTSVLRKIEFARWMMTWHCEISDSKLRICASPLRPPCPFPHHNPECQYSDTCHYPNEKQPDDESEPILVVMRDDDDISVCEFPSSITAQDLLDEKNSSDDQPGKMRPYQVKVNNETLFSHDLNKKLQMGDLVQLEKCDPLPSHALHYAYDFIGSNFVEDRFNIWPKQTSKPSQHFGSSDGRITFSGIC